MNIFHLNSDPRQAAQDHCDKHVVKMIVETAQLLSCAHRVLDGTPMVVNGKRRIMLPGEDASDPVCYHATHSNHPSAVWARQTSGNYHWLYWLFAELSGEYTHRYGRIHSTWLKLADFLSCLPNNIPDGERTEFALAMPDEYKVKGDAVQSYRNYYLGSKKDIARWTNRQAPDWFVAGCPDFKPELYERHK